MEDGENEGAEWARREGGNGGRENKALRVNGEDKKMVNLKNYGVHTDKRQTSFFLLVLLSWMIYIMFMWYVLRPL